MISYHKIFSNSEFIIINKPAGLLVHGADHINEPTLADQLLEEFPKIAKVGDDPIRPGIIHRLDKLASGIMVIARTQDSFDHLKEHFKTRKVKKYYTALVHGQIDKDEDEITFPIKRSSKGNKMAAIPTTDKGEINQIGRLAKTQFWVEKNYINYTLLRVRTKTGRTHQIRCHLSAYGHPLVGDDLYATKKTKVKNAKLNLGRIFLVADQLEFTDLTGKKQKFTIELPSVLQNLLKIIK